MLIARSNLRSASTMAGLISNMGAPASPGKVASGRAEIGRCRADQESLTGMIAYPPRAKRANRRSGRDLAGVTRSIHGQGCFGQCGHAARRALAWQASQDRDLETP